MPADITEDPSSGKCLTLSITYKGSKLLDLFIIYKSGVELLIFEVTRLDIIDK